MITRWTELTRERLTDLLPDSLVVLPVGAVEQHGPHLPTWTDALLVTTVVERALDITSARTVLAPTVMTGASDQHLPFGGTLSLRPETLLAVLLDLARSVAECGGRRLVLVNGHGGNQGACTDAASAAVVRYGLSTCSCSRPRSGATSTVTSRTRPAPQRPRGRSGWRPRSPLWPRGCRSWSAYCDQPLRRIGACTEELRPRRNNRLAAFLPE
ncbi:creatininase family protein [Nonomuraea insulae]|uniref:Creatininase family protein n=1 Tax=Nonomuraea insulae TaxID=1616787 RepID=A0ABW1CN11_9ACTN